MSREEHAGAWSGTAGLTTRLPGWEAWRPEWANLSAPAVIKAPAEITRRLER
jgi:hypothetical protein